MAGVMFTLLLLAILTAVGFVFALMVQLMSEPDAATMPPVAAMVPVKEKR